MRTRKWVGLAVWLAVTFTASFVGSRFTPGTWYDGLTKPAWNPPSWVFAPVWTLLYVLMAVAAWTVWRRAGFRGAPLALGLYILQLVLNGAWSWLFFGAEEPLLALVDLVALFLVVAVTTVLFWRAERRAGILLLPYLAWLAYAGSLNAAIWHLNPGA